jgi:hypothetical protein
MKPFVITVVICLYTIVSLGQKDRVNAATLIRNSDSVVLISHITILEYHEKDEGIVEASQILNNTRHNEYPSFFKDRVVNPSIIVQRKLLSKSDILKLSSIIKSPVKRSSIGSVSLCFEPHHAILIYTNDRFSYIDICFHCRDIVNSADISLSNSDFDDRKWANIRSFFKNNDLTYELDEKR